MSRPRRLLPRSSPQRRRGHHASMVAAVASVAAHCGGYHDVVAARSVGPARRQGTPPSIAVRRGDDGNNVEGLRMTQRLPVAVACCRRGGEESSSSSSSSSSSTTASRRGRLVKLGGIMSSHAQRGRTSSRRRDQSSVDSLGGDGTGGGGGGGAWRGDVQRVGRIGGGAAVAVGVGRASGESGDGMNGVTRFTTGGGGFRRCRRRGAVAASAAASSNSIDPVDNNNNTAATAAAKSSAPPELPILVIVECAMLAALTGLSFHLSTLFRMDAYFGRARHSPGLHSLPGGVRLVARTVPAVMD
jgi:hypothetical protein